MGVMYGYEDKIVIIRNLMYAVDKYPANLVTMHSHSQLDPLKPPAQAHMQVPVSKVPPF